MKTYSLEAKKRTELGKKSSQKLRAQEQVPCVMYGTGDEIIHFHAHINKFKNLIYTNQVFLVDLSIDGTAYKAIVKDIQYHPVTDAVIHMDFIQVKEDVPAVVSLPITLVGTSKGILAGGKLRQRRRYLKVKGLLANLPETLEIDITKMGIGSVKKISDLAYDNLELLDPAQAMVIGIVSSRLAAKGMEAGESEEVGETAEGGEEATAEAAAE
ncbi:MAG: 50S ribosomal protein L25 [Bacteroidales bacterium]|nr:50S ribosomal protein L25 [Bacteroidales bacterium]MBN2819391.1 50S ribosomal protein L25 [Bacteroidales bacterium]